MISDWNKCYKYMTDDESKEIYINRLNYLITNDYKYIWNINKNYPLRVDTNSNEIDELIMQLPDDKDIILYGAGGDANVGVCFFRNDNRFKGLCDRDVNKQKSGIYGCKVFSPEELYNDKNCSVVISTHLASDEIKESLMHNGVDENRFILCICLKWL